MRANSKLWTEKENATANCRGIFKVLSECSVGLIKTVETSVLRFEPITSPSGCTNAAYNIGIIG
jgi:hypothetical protein